MRVNVDPLTVNHAVSLVSYHYYGNNLTIRDMNQETNSRNTWTTFTLKVYDSRGKGARRSGSGRRGPWACWHAHWHVLRELFKHRPGMKVRTAFYSVDGYHDWEDAAERSANINAGSPMRPVSFVDLCECDLHEDDLIDHRELMASLRP